MTSFLQIEDITYDSIEHLCDYCGRVTCENHILQINEYDGINTKTIATMDDLCHDCYVKEFTDIKIMK